jgi:hypothetical protein
MKEGIEKAEEEWSAKDDGVLVGVGMSYGGDDAGMEHAIKESGSGEDETDQGAGGADVEEGASGADGGAHEDERTKGADERGEGNEERVAGVNVMVAAGKEMAEFVGEENGQQGGGEGQAGEKGRGIFVEKSEGAQEFVERSCLIVGVGEGELGACGQAGPKREEKERYGKNE